MFLTGPPDVGKTEVCRCVAETARHRGLRVCGLITEARRLASGRIVQTVLNVRTGERRRLADYVGVDEGEPIGSGAAGRFSWTFVGEVDSPPPGEPGSKLPLLQRLARPADRVAPTPGIWPGDAYEVAEVTVTGKGVTGAIAAACVAAVAEHNRTHSAPLRKVGITVAVGGPAGVGNVASYRRIDVAPDGQVAAEVQAALASPDEPGEQVRAPKLVMALLEPVVERFSDTILVSNLGRHEIPGVHRLDFFPVARGRSAVCFASAAVAGGATTLTLRARDLSPGDARRLLADAAARLDQPR